MTALFAGPSPAVADDDLIRAEGESGMEYVHGQLVEKPVSMDSSLIASTIGFLLNLEARKTDEARVFESSLGYQCYPDDPMKFRKPDVSLLRTSRIAGMRPSPGLCPIPADLVVEVNSPTDKIYDVEEKVEEYLRAGFKLLWIVQPNTRTVTIHRGDRSTTRLRESDEITGESALPGFKCRVADFFDKVS